MAPSAATYEAILAKEREVGDCWGDEVGGEVDLVAAALAGLPDADEANQLAALAAAGGGSLQEILKFSHSASESAQRRRHRSGGGDGTDQSLELETGHESDILQDGEAANAWKDRRTPAENWKQLRKKRKVDKEKKKNAWLYS